jgi:diacylglycerol kinase family enzyme
MKAIVVLNCGSGAVDPSKAEAEAARVAAALGSVGLEAVVQAVPASGLEAAARAAASSSDADTVVFGGGDGTLSTGAATLAGGEKVLGVLPLGTFNHFAKDLGVPLKLEDAARTIAEGRVRRVDLGEASGRTFLNNASIGLYPEIVRGRDELRRHHGTRKWVAMLAAAREVLRDPPFLRVTLRVLDDVARLRTPFVFVGNNRYEMELFSLGARSSLDRGELSLYVAHNVRRWGILRLALRALLGRLRQDKDFEALAVPEVDVSTPRRIVRVALDGELFRMESPIRFRIRPGALRVLAPYAGEP